MHLTFMTVTHKWAPRTASNCASFPYPTFSPALPVYHAYLLLCICQSLFPIKPSQQWLEARTVSSAQDFVAQQFESGLVGGFFCWAGLVSFMWLWSSDDANGAAWSQVAVGVCYWMSHLSPAGLLELLQVVVGEFPDTSVF